MAYSGLREIAYNAGYDDGRFGRPINNPYNQTAVPDAWRAYEEGYAEGSISTEAPRGPQGPQGEKGDPGPAGAPGATGTPGADGNFIYTGIGAPSSVLGNVNDVYIDADDGTIYEKTGVTTWTIIGGPSMALAVQLDDTGGTPNVLYKGEAVPGSSLAAAVWRVQKITVAVDGDVSIQWADGNDSFDNIWNNRASLIYS